MGRLGKMTKLDFKVTGKKKKRKIGQKLIITSRWLNDKQKDRKKVHNNRKKQKNQRLLDKAFIKFEFVWK